MLASAIIAARLMQFGGAMVLLGSPLFLLYSPAVPRGQAPQGLAPMWPRPLLLGAAVVLGVGAVVALWAQAAVLNDAPIQTLSPAAVLEVITSTKFGMFTAARVGLAALGGLLLIGLRPSRGLWLALTATGVLTAASFVWTGHGSAGDGALGPAHMASDFLHLLAAAVWLGALASLALSLVTADASSPAELDRLHRSLAGLSGVGSGAVLVLLVSGIMNSWVLVGPDHVGALLQDPYGRLLCAKVVIFAVMITFAAVNRFRLTPSLRLAIDGHGSLGKALGDLRRSVVSEAVAGLLVLVAVAALGTLPPPISQ